ncbi:ribose-5-phosphate isomerase [Candidatus Berkelbacteria bacterium CG06_land_8_20_14_3_00_43_10]|uniref:Ribose-5-phosphate isomerase n=1 Tax=Candidatus Berkelbacteria bacterium CG10_big_fil_rev_8_21_14_0_10_43_14 TaxID=1974515 RepID=A0A2M6R8Z6_9BACT|nr:MAG: hypothetical protein AUK41_03270 [Candidatus Berkelbacteria bacterium CG2_30_43_20]PIS07003.1 MAG: ribose-5-phosphate isomerase [Candidatus Berkelbacteria bacterium CG10_big_fil_rev_8_21_14_0_10_43_14]PIU87476.1 MAG: ribose-5-phosphate isomerase [Candidatus Berkelbacteria bacterium CG06_land_8_20_14_3_00_43_10]
MSMLYIASDHAGFTLKEQIIHFLQEKGIAFTDVGAFSVDPDDDYPDYAKLLGEAMSSPDDRGIAICASGQGICIACNRFSHIRAAHAWSVETAQRARTDDDANVLCLAGEIKNNDPIEVIVATFCDTHFDASEKHTRRLDKLELISKVNR